MVEAVEIARQNAGRIMEFQESAKRHVSKYLHGHGHSEMLALQYDLGQCQELLHTDPTAASGLLERIMGELRQLQEDDVHRVSHDSYPSVIRMGLIPALRDSLAGAVEIDLVVGEGLLEMDRFRGVGLSEKFKIGVYRIVEEAMSNVIKHSGRRKLEWNWGRPAWRGGCR